MIVFVQQLYNTKMDVFLPSWPFFYLLPSFLPSSAASSWFIFISSLSQYAVKSQASPSASIAPPSTLKSLCVCALFICLQRLFEFRIGSWKQHGGSDSCEDTVILECKNSMMLLQYMWLSYRTRGQTGSTVIVLLTLTPDSWTVKTHKQKAHTCIYTHIIRNTLHHLNIYCLVRVLDFGVCHSNNT